MLEMHTEAGLHTHIIISGTVHAHIVSISCTLTSSAYRARSHRQHIVHAHIVSLVHAHIISAVHAHIIISIVHAHIISIVHPHISIVHAHIISISCTRTSSAPCTVQRRISTVRAHINIVHLTHTPASLLNKSEWKHRDIIMMGIWPHFHFYIIKMHNTQ